MSVAKVNKAIAGALAGGVGSVGTAVVMIPSDVEMPWYGYLLVGVINAALAFATVYLAPRNRA